MNNDRITIIRAEHGPKNPYLMLLRATAQDETISFEARGLLIYLLSKPDNWTLMVADLMRAGGCGRDRIYRIVKELCDAGYICRTFEKDEQRRVMGVIYEINEFPIFKNAGGEMGCEEPLPENPDTDNPDTENQTLHNTEEQEEEKTKGVSLARHASPLFVPPGAQRVDTTSLPEPKKRYGKSDEDMPIAGRVILDVLNGKNLSANQVENLRLPVRINEKDYPSPVDLALKDENRFREYVEHVRKWMMKTEFTMSINELIRLLRQYGAQYRGWFDFNGQKTVDGNAIPKSAPAVYIEGAEYTGPGGRVVEEIQ